ncbi:beta-ketoacyl synthase N-terminal-like domain-containing protein, partial [Mucilaginibacter angelicae]
MIQNKKYDGLEIAIIGISLRFPGSDNYKKFWDNLQNGNESVTTFSDEELTEQGVSVKKLQNKLYVKSAAIITNKEFFDNEFFGYGFEEAALMDPQIRIFHEHCWHALEDSGYSSQISNKKIGLFAGASINNNWKIYANGQAGNSSVDPFYLNMISNQAHLSSLVSYKLNLRGPAIYIDTACSTSLVAVHQACRSLLMKECGLALAGGVTINTLKTKGYLYEDGMINSSDGHCRAFDQAASGCVGGEGVGIVVLKRLSEALKDNDHIYAIIKGSAVNNDGNNKVGYTAPGVEGQAECIKNAQKFAGVLPESISYIEAHGTGTRLGDPIEVEALNIAFNRDRTHRCAIGS